MEKFTKLCLEVTGVCILYSIATSIEMKGREERFKKLRREHEAQWQESLDRILANQQAVQETMELTNARFDEALERFYESYPQLRPEK